ncbi:MAG TPA: CHAT domain-containing protein [Thermoanaerobaculia bacterium]|nr:CHAT domain-containing protein [Thermoanaerobaculia bacterium]
MPRASAAVVFLAGLAAGCGAAARGPAAVVADPAPPPAAATLLAAEPVAAEIAPGETHRYRLPTGPGRWLTVELAQRAADVDARVVDAAGTVVAQAVTPGNWTREELDLLAGEGGPWSLEIAAAAGVERKGDYRVRVAEERPARPDDPARLAARRELRALRLAEHAHGDEEASVALLRRLLADDAVDWRHAERAELFLQLGTLLADGRHAEESAAAFRDGLDLLADQPPTPVEVELRLLLAHLQRDRRSLDEAAESYARAVEVARATGDGSTLSLALAYQAQIHYLRKDFQACAELTRQAAEAARRAGDAPGEVSNRINLSQMLQLLGDPLAALAEHEEAARVARERAVRDERNRALLLRNAGALYRQAGDLDRALTAFVDGLEIALANGDAVRETTLRLHFGALLNQLGEYGDAREHLLEVVRLAELRQDARYLVQAQLHLGWSELAEGDPAAALAHLERASLLAGDDGPDAAPLRYATAVAKLRLGDLAAARKLLAEIVAGAAGSGQRTMLLDSRRALGELLLAQGEHDLAAGELASAVALAVELDDPLRQAASASALARLEAERGRHADALEHARSAIRLRESVRSRIVDPDLRSSFLARWRGDFDLAIETLMLLAGSEPAAGYERQAFRLSEAAHARTLTELLTEARVDVEQGIAPALLAEEQEAERRVSLVESRLSELAAAPAPADAAKLRERERQEERLRRDRELARQRRDELERRIRREHPRYAEIRYPQPPGVEQVQEWLPADTALVEYALGERSSAVFVVTRDGFAAATLPGGGEIARLIGELRDDLERPPSGLARRLPADAVGALTRALVAPVAERLAEVRRLIVVPDRDLFYLPFEVLADPAASDGEPGGLLRRWTVSYLPSAAVLPHLARPERQDWRRELRVFADPAAAPALAADRRDALAPLPGAQREAKRIAALFPVGGVDLLVGEEALESRLKQTAAEPAARRLHIASHGVISVEDAASSYVLFAADPGEDGRLYLDEVFNLDLAAELVVLSGCETALGPRVVGEGLLGFARGFLYAGARDLVVSLWPVSDAGTEELMVDFYRHLLAGARPAEALRAAKLARIDDGAAHPFLWAPFVVFGGPPPAAP